MRMDDQQNPPLMVWIFGLAGLAPFFGLAGAFVFSGEAGTLTMLSVYGAVILSFIGGCRWGFSSAGYGPGASMAAMMIAVAPSLYAAASPLLAMGVSILADRRIALPFIAPVLAIGHLLMLAEDWRATRAGWVPPWWITLRLPLGVGAALSLLAPALLG